MTVKGGIKPPVWLSGSQCKQTLEQCTQRLSISSENPSKHSSCSHDEPQPRTDLVLQTSLWGQQQLFATGQGVQPFSYQERCTSCLYWLHLQRGACHHPCGVSGKKNRLSRTPFSYAWNRVSWDWMIPYRNGKDICAMASGLMLVHIFSVGAGAMVCVGPSGETPIDLDVASAENKAFMNIRTGERQEMVILNDRLAVYIDKVRAFRLYIMHKCINIFFLQRKYVVQLK